MQIFHWLFKAPHHEPSRDNPSDQRVKQKEVFLFRNRSRSDKDTTRSTKSSRKKDFKAAFAILCRKDVAKACFYSTINLKQLATCNRWEVRRRASEQTMKKEDIIARGLGMVSHRRSADSASSHVGSKVLPLSEVATVSSSSSTGEIPCMAEIKEKVKGEKVKAMSRMKELLRWAAATRSADKGGGGGKFLARKMLLLRNRPALKAVPDEDELGIESPKISFRWDAESYSTTTSSAFSGVSSSRIDQFISSQSASRKANWITTDSDFVVLEL